MIPETENPHQAKSVCPGYPARHAKADPGGYFTQSPQSWLSRGMAHITKKYFSMCTNSVFYINIASYFGLSGSARLN